MGDPLVMWFIFGDQGPNAWQMETNMAGLQVERNEKYGSFNRHGVVSVVCDVMVEGGVSSGVITGVTKIHDIIASMERHERFINEFIEHLGSSYTNASATTGGVKFTITTTATISS